MAARKPWTVTLKVNELVFDVQNKTYLTGLSRQTGDNHEEVAHMQASDDDENAEQIRRSVKNAFSRLKTKLSEYLVTDPSEAGSNNELKITNNTDMVITLSMPSNFNKNAGANITDLCHQYVVNVAVNEWFAITNKSDAQDYAVMAEQNLAGLREAISKRVRPTRGASE